MATAEISYIVGSAEAIEAEYGFEVGAPFAIVQFYQDEVSQWFPCATMTEAKADIEWMTDGPVSYL